MNILKIASLYNFFPIILYLHSNEGSWVNGNNKLNSPRKIYNDLDLCKEMNDYNEFLNIAYSRINTIQGHHTQFYCFCLLFVSVDVLVMICMVCAC